MLTDGGSFVAVTPIVVQDGLCESHLYPPPSERHLARAVISGCALYIVCLVVGALGAGPGVPPWHSQTECPGRLQGLYHHRKTQTPRDRSCFSKSAEPKTPSEKCAYPMKIYMQFQGFSSVFLKPIHVKVAALGRGLEPPVQNLQVSWRTGKQL